MAANTEGFKNWTDASINSKSLELYDINGQKLFYQFFVYKNNNLVGRINVNANKTLGQSVQSFEFNPKPFNATETMSKSIEIAKDKYPTGEIVSTKMVVYDYPLIGAMTVIKDKTTGDKHWIIVDVYTFDVVQDKSATGTEPEVFSIYEQKSKNGINENLKGWNESNQLTDFIKQKATNIGIDISVPITKENMIKLCDDTAIKSTTMSKTLNVPLSGQGTSTIVSPSYITTTVTLNVPLKAQQNSYYCCPASGQMIAAYYGKSQTQSYIMGIMGGGTSGCTNDQELKYYKASNGLAKTSSYVSTTDLSYKKAKSEIDNKRPFRSGVYHIVTGTGHARVCRGYVYNIYGEQYLALNNP